MSDSKKPPPEPPLSGSKRGKDSKHPPADSVTSKLERIKQSIWKRRPILSEIMKKHGDKTLYRYSQDFMDINPSPLLDARKPELIATAKELIEERLGADVAAGVARQLTKYPLVSTTDHHGPIQHPFFLNANIVSAIPYLENTDPDLNYLIVFSFASVSVNNASAYPRGIIFHGDKNGSGSFVRLPILPDKLKMGVVYGTRSFTREDLTKAELELLKKEKGGEVALGRGEQIRNLMEEFCGDRQILGAPDLSEQITEMNFRLWPRLFHNAENRTAGCAIPDLIYLEIETLVRELMIKHHLTNPASPLYKVLFNGEYRALALKYFNNLPGAFSLENGWGSFFFWAVDDKLHRVQLKLGGNTTASLHSKHHSYSYELNPQEIEKALKERKIFPSMLLCYLLVSLYYGMKCLGGFCQVHDLTKTKEAWQKLLREMNNESEADAVTPVQTKELGGDGLVLAYLKTVDGSLIPATGIDLVLEKTNTSYEKYVELSKRVTLSEMMNPMLPEMYTVLYPFPDREPELATLSPESILKETGLEEKLAQ